MRLKLIFSVVAGALLLSSSAIARADAPVTDSSASAVDAKTISDLRDEIELLKAKSDEEKLKSEIRKDDGNVPPSPDDSVKGLKGIMATPSAPPFVVSIVKLPGDVSARISVGGHISMVRVGEHVTVDDTRYVVKDIDDSSVILSDGKKMVVLRAN